VATIYRYFPSRGELLSAAAQEPARQALAAQGSRPDDELATFVHAMWTDFARNLPLLRHQISSTAGRDMRQARLERSRDALGAYLVTKGLDPTSPEGERVLELSLLLTGSLGLLELHDRQGVPVERAVPTVLWAVEALIEATSRPT